MIFEYCPHIFAVFKSGVLGAFQEFLTAMFSIMDKRLSIPYFHVRPINSAISLVLLVYCSAWRASVLSYTLVLRASHLLSKHPGFIRRQGTWRPRRSVALPDVWEEG
jgi:hypothetical protein